MQAFKENELLALKIIEDTPIFEDYPLTIILAQYFPWQSMRLIKEVHRDREDGTRLHGTPDVFMSKLG